MFWCFCRSGVIVDIFFLYLIWYLSIILYCKFLLIGCYVMLILVEFIFWVVIFKGGLWGVRRGKIVI